MRPYIPVFSGNPEDLSEFVTMILEDMSLETLAYYAVQNYANEGQMTKSGYILPPTATGGRDGVAGISTDFPMTMHLGQTFDDELLEEIGQVMADEQIWEKGGDTTNTLFYSAVSDVRVNPLCGRYYEGFSEDPYLTASLAGRMVKGAAGEDSFYLKTQIALKHFTAYQAEWNRENGTNYVGSRSLHEWHYPPFIQAVRNGAAGVMTSYGATNEIPNCISPFLDELDSYAPHRLFNVSDFGADSYLEMTMGKNGERAYAQNGYQVAGLMIKSGAFSNNIDKELVSQEDYQKAVENMLYGLKRKDMEELVRPLIELWVRSGFFNQENYPYAKQDKEDKGAENIKHQELCKRSGREGLVLLKNNGQLLPLKPGSSILVTGIFSDMRTQPMYTVPTPKQIENAGETPIEALRKMASSYGHDIWYAPELSAKAVMLMSDRGYLTTREIGNQQIITIDGTKEEALCLQIYDWGQGAYSFIHLETRSVLSLEGEGYAKLIPYDKKQIPPVYTYEMNDDGTRSIRADSIIDRPFEMLQISHGVPFYRYDSMKGRYLIPYGKFVRKGRETGRDFGQGIDKLCLVEEVVSYAGERSSDYAEKSDYAVVFIGEEPRINASEMKDRQDMSFGKDQIELVKNVAKSYPERTVVVVRSDFPMDMREIQENENVGAILYLSYAGEFDSLVLAEVLMGVVSPGGRLSTAWHKSLESLPQIKSGAGTGSGKEQDLGYFVKGQYHADSQYQIDMKAIDAEEFHLTYQYMNEKDILYPFGYGLSYGSFSYENICYFPEYEQITFELINRGKRVSDEVVQLYAKSLQSGYGSHVPQRQLAAYKRIKEVAPGERRKVVLTLDRKALERWDVSRQKYIVEEGRYEIYLGKNACDILWNQIIELCGERLGKIKIISPRNIWEICAASRKMKAVEISKKRTALRRNEGYFAVESDENYAWLMLYQLDLQHVRALGVRALYMGEGEAEIYFYEGKMFCGKSEAEVMRGEGCLAKCVIKKAQMVQYYLDDLNTLKVVEPEYEEYCINLEDSLEKVVDMYLVFPDKGVRLESICAKGYESGL